MELGALDSLSSEDIFLWKRGSFQNGAVLEAVISFLLLLVCVSCSLFPSPQIIVIAFVLHADFLSLPIFDVCRRELGITFRNVGRPSPCGM